MGKVVKFTGSRLLGEELRRLRAGRTLDDVVELGKTKLVPSGFRYVGKGTLSDIENGKVLPNLESVFALSVLYQVPASRFLHFLLEENVVEGIAAPETEEELLAAFASAMHERDWTRALGIAVCGLRRHETGWSNLRWRLSRAVAIERLGLRTDAITELNGLLHDRDLPRDERWKVHHHLARMHASAGQLRLAEMHVTEAALDLPRSPTPEVQRQALELQLHVFIMAHEHGHSVRTTADVAEGWIREARLLASREDMDQQAFLDLCQARLHSLKGEAKFARRLLVRVLDTVLKLDLPHRQVEALVASALHDEQLSRETVLSRLQRAAEIASEHNFLDQAFYVLVLLAQQAESPEQRAHFLRKCQRLYPLVQSASPGVSDFLAMRRGEVQ